MKQLEQYQIDEIVTLLQEFRYRSQEEEDLVEEIDSVLELLEEGEE
jgi:hypothetical protein